MHYSQSPALSQLGSNGPYKWLAVNDCVGCHSATDGDTWKNPITGAPIVYNIQEPTYGASYNGGPKQGLAGGNFYWVEHVDDNRGHNVFENNPDDYLTEAPGNIKACGGNNPCHNNLHGTYTEGDKTSYIGRQGCTKCHMYLWNPDTSYNGNSWHHNEQSGRYAGDRFSGNWYRFLAAPHTANRDSGVVGMEDPDWEYTRGSNDHNDYYGNPITNLGRPLKSHSIDGFCLGCHWYFCDTSGESPFHKHPVAMVIPNEGEYANAYGDTHAYDPLVPVGQPSLSETPSTTVTLGTDMVMCLSCHRAHGSPYPDMLRWNYEVMVAGDTEKSGGCFVCHTKKINPLRLLNSIVFKSPLYRKPRYFFFP